MKPTDWITFISRKKYWAWASTTLVLILLVSCGSSNLFTPVSNRTSDEALFLDAMKKIDDMDWSGAITILSGQLSAKYKQRTDVREALMGAYAGQCGLSFITLLNALSTGSASGGLFTIGISAFGGLSVNTAACDSAVEILAALGTASERSTNQNLYGAFLGIAKLGVNLHKTLDTESAGLGDGAVDSGFDACSAPGTTTSGKLTDAQIKKIIVGMGLVFENISALSSSLGNGNAFLTTIDSLKTNCENVAGGAGSCTITDENSTSINASLITLFRRMIASQNYGLGTCDMTTGACCP
jgi:hypothetical protein